MATVYCRECGKEISDQARICPHCGVPVNVAQKDQNKSEKEWLVALLLCFFAGCLGIHRFYVGKVGTGIIQLFTCGGCGIWALIDLIIIVCGNFTDAEGKRIHN